MKKEPKSKERNLKTWRIAEEDKFERLHKILTHLNQSINRGERDSRPLMLHMQL